ncbi:hypothetical protein HZC09_03220 [Candidatus Micrarchaeota archaeon]|nr:hypothetical protein [Candidatus Micrarchaeota archaeon]
MKRGQYATPARAYESLIPLILIVILGVFIAGKFGFLQLNSLPVVGSLFPSPQIKVVVIGQSSQQMKDMLISEDFRQNGITYVTDLRQDFIVPGVLDNMDIIILQGGQICDRTPRKTIADRVKAGGKLIVIGDACIRVNEDPNAVGWDIGIGSLGDVVPVTYRGVLFHERQPTKGSVDVAGGKFKIVAPSHPMFNGILNYQFSGRVTEVLPNQNAKVLAYIDSVGGMPTAPATFGIIESQGLLAGKTMYFSFDPATNIAGVGSRNMLLNTLLYLKGGKG